MYIEIGVHSSKRSHFVDPCRHLDNSVISLHVSLYIYIFCCCTQIIKKTHCAVCKSGLTRRTICGGSFRDPNSRQQIVSSRIINTYRSEPPRRASHRETKTPRLPRFARDRETFFHPRRESGEPSLRCPAKKRRRAKTPRANFRDRFTTVSSRRHRYLVRVPGRSRALRRSRVEYLPPRARRPRETRPIAPPCARPPHDRRRYPRLPSRPNGAPIADGAPPFRLGARTSSGAVRKISFVGERKR